MALNFIFYSIWPRHGVITDIEEEKKIRAVQYTHTHTLCIAYRYCRFKYIYNRRVYHMNKTKLDSDETIASFMWNAYTLEQKSISKTKINCNIICMYNRAKYYTFDTYTPSIESFTFIR